MAVQNTASINNNLRGIMVPNPEFVRDCAFIDGRWVAAANGRVFAVNNPADNTIISEVPDMGAADTTIAIEAAHTAFTFWKNVPPLDRADILLRWSDLMVEKADDLALLMTFEQGKPLNESHGEVLAGAATIRWSAEEGRRLYGEYIEGAKQGTKILISRHPLGVVGAITPWNFPIGMVTRKVGPALAAGCTVVLKPSEATPLSAFALAVLAEKAGIPPGVLNIITTSNAKEIGRTFTEDARVRKISFTGSTGVGRTLMKQAATHIQKLSLELGGNAPFIVFESADCDKALEGIMASKFRNAGQTCICANRIYIHSSLYKTLEAKLKERIEALPMGPGWQQNVKIGPLINPQAAEKIERMVLSAIASGARLLTGGKISEGRYFTPTLMTDVPESCDLVQQEIFGPVAVITPFDEEEEVIRRANDTAYGLSSYMYTSDLAQAWRVSDALESGMVAINEPFLATDLAPFGGIKESGIGREGGKYGLLEYTDVKYRLFG